VIVPAVVVKFAVALPAAIETTPGTLRLPLLLESPTVPPPAFDSVTVQFVVVPLTKLVDAHVRELMFVCASSEIDEACDEPFNDAVTVAAASAVTVPAVAVKVPVVLPAATTMAPGTLRTALLLESPTVAPPVFDRVTVQVLLAPVPNVDGEHDSEVTVAVAIRSTDAV
jgi:hypothetical protein